MFFIKSLFFACSFFSSIMGQSPHLSVTQPPDPLVDQAVTIHINHLIPFQTIKLETRAEDQNGTAWSSHATFKANEHGVIDVDNSVPLNGSSYKMADRMGLFWSMQPESGEVTHSFKCKNDRLTVQLKLFANDKLISEKRISRHLKHPKIKRVEIKEHGLSGTLFTPLAQKAVPVIITLSGSNGGLSETRAKLLASNGFAVFALAYFGVDGLPSTLSNIPLEYFENAFAWLKDQPNIDASRLGLYGVSRGAELSLLLGSIFPNSVQAIVAALPSSTVFGGFSETAVNAWIYQGKPLFPFAPVPKATINSQAGQTSSNPINTRQNFIEAMREQASFRAAAIPVENIHCPLLLISAGDDQMWPSDIFANQIIERLETTHSPIICHHLHYPEAGHGINVPNLPIPSPVYFHPIPKLWFSMGGSRSANAKASRDSWAKLVAFFHNNLQPSTKKRTIFMDNKKYRYNHIGIPTTKKLKNEKYLPDYDVYTAGYEENAFNIEWMRYGKKCTVPDIVKQLPHVAFEVDDIYEAIEGHEVIIEPNSPSEGVIVAFVLINDAPVEFLQWTDREGFEKKHSNVKSDEPNAK